MADFPYPSRFHMPTITSYSPNAALNTANIRPLIAGGAATTTSHAWPTGNLVILVPFMISSPYLVKSVFWLNGGTAAGNMDCGVYTADASELLFNAGTTAQSGTSVPQAVALGTAVLLEPGTYYMALVNSGTSGTGVGPSTNITTQALESTGCAQAANGALPLAASQTLAAPSSFGGVLTPVFGISSRASTLI